MTPLAIALNLVLSIGVLTGIAGLLSWSIASQRRSRRTAESRRPLRLVESPRSDSLGITDRKAAA
jgi:hypothetical protein